MILDQGLELIRDLHKADISTGKLGTNGAAVATTQTNLVSGITLTNLTRLS